MFKGLSTTLKIQYSKMKFVLKPDNRNASDKQLLDDLKKVAKEIKKGISYPK